MTPAEMNQKIAEWLGWTEMVVHGHTLCGRNSITGEHGPSPDFFHSMGAWIKSGALEKIALERHKVKITYPLAGTLIYSVTIAKPNGHLIGKIGDSLPAALCRAWGEMEAPDVN